MHVVETDQDDHAHQSHEQPVNYCAADLCIDLSSHSASRKSAEDHPHQKQRRDGWDSTCDNGNHQAGNLGQEDDIDRILGSYFGLHGEEIVQYHQIDRTAANTQEGGHNAQPKSNKQADHFAGEPESRDLLFKDGVDQSSDGDNGKYDCLYRADSVSIVKKRLYSLEALFACDSAYNGADTQVSTDAHINDRFLVHF